MTNVVDRLINDVEFLSVNNITDDARRKNNFAFLVRNSIYGRFQGFVLSQVYSVDIKEKHIKSDPKGLTCCLIKYYGRLFQDWTICIEQKTLPNIGQASMTT